MALPQLAFATFGSFSAQGPLKSTGGNYYAFVGNPNQLSIGIYKATDPTSAWVLQTSISTVSGSGGFIFDLKITTTRYANTSDVVHIAALTGAGNGTLIVNYYAYDMSTDTVTVTNAGIISGLIAVYPGPSISIAARTNGEVIILYPSSARIMSADYARSRLAWRSTGGTWTTNIAVDAITGAQDSAPLAALAGDPSTGTIGLLYTSPPDVCLKYFPSSNSITGQTEFAIYIDQYSKNYSATTSLSSTGTWYNNIAVPGAEGTPPYSGNSAKIIPTSTPSVNSGITVFRLYLTYQI